jgi:hypothetical protein
MLRQALGITAANVLHHLHCISCRRLLRPIKEPLDVHLELWREDAFNKDAKPLLPYAVAFDASADSLDALLEQTHQRAFALWQGFFSGKCFEQKQFCKASVLPSLPRVSVVQPPQRRQGRRRFAKAAVGRISQSALRWWRMRATVPRFEKFVWGRPFYIDDYFFFSI